MTGLELVKHVRLLRPGIPIILCTGFSQKVTGKSARQAGLNHVLMKPVAFKELGDTVRRVLNDRSRD
jgi:two-component system, cell cycle sensor histidine kinase and response regulator CckA